MATAMALMPFLAVVPPSSAAKPGSTACSVKVAGKGKAFTAVQPAVDAVPAASSATLTVTGVCFGRITITGKDITLSAGRSRGTLDGRDADALQDGGYGSVITVTDASLLTISGLTIKSGSADYGAGINTRGSVTLNSGTVMYNNYGFGPHEYGGGIYCNGSGSIRVLGGSQIHDNTAVAGGGIYTEGCSVYLAEPGSWIGSNVASSVGGGIFAVSAQVDVVGPDNAFDSPTHISGNFAGHDAIGQGGGVYIMAGTMHMDGYSYVWGNSAVAAGGGIYSNGSTISALAGFLGSSCSDANASAGAGNTPNDLDISSGGPCPG